MVCRGGDRCDFIRRRDQRGRRGGAADRRRLPGRRVNRPRGPGSGARRGLRLARGPHPGRRDRSPPRGPTARARTHPPPLSAVVRVLHPRRLDRHPGGGPLRDPLHPHRRSGRVRAGHHTAWDVGEPPAPGVRGRPEPGSPAARLRGHARDHHRGLGAGAGASPVQALGGRCLRFIRGGSGGGARARPVGPQPLELPPARRHGVRGHERRAGRQGGAGPGIRVGPPSRR